MKSEWSMIRFYTGNIREFNNLSAIVLESQQCDHRIHNDNLLNYNLL
jgi:hypothetical protein